VGSCTPSDFTRGCITTRFVAKDGPKSEYHSENARLPEPPNKTAPLDAAKEKLLAGARSLTALRSSSPADYRRRALFLWGRAHDMVLRLDRRQGALLLHEIAEAINGTVTGAAVNSGRIWPNTGTALARPRRQALISGAAREWLNHLLHGEMGIASLGYLGTIAETPLLLARASDGTLRQRKKAAAVLANLSGMPIRTIAASLSISRVSVRKYVRLFTGGGVKALFARRKWACGRRAENELTRQAVFALLHEPPSASGINRTSWRMEDLTRVLRKRGTPVCAQVVREITRSAGWRWRRARRVLTSTDPEYRQKVRHIQEILADLQEDEAFFSIDEFGPFTIRAQGGRKLVAPGEVPTVPQYQKSKGSLIMTAALELSRNQITYFYSPRKDTGEMLRMIAKLVREYSIHKRSIYLSWDAASWHMSKMLYTHVAEHNDAVNTRDAAGP
jgi:transposase